MSSVIGRRGIWFDVVLLEFTTCSELKCGPVHRRLLPCVSLTKIVFIINTTGKYRHSYHRPFLPSNAYRAIIRWYVEILAVPVSVSAQSRKSLGRPWPLKYTKGISNPLPTGQFCNS